ncbi:MAG: hypothetical protein LBQ64_00730, partial [Bacteroidales bacterium]|nr:hypothetical protein [Bacteroidales bacterium]
MLFAKVEKFLFVFGVCFLALLSQAKATQLLIPMDKTQSNHLKAYGIAYWILSQDQDMSWLLNYRGGSFLCSYSEKIA